MSSGSISVEPPAAAAAAPPVAADSGKGPGLGRYGAGTLFLLPALILLVIWMVYPIVYTVARSFFGRSGFDDFVGIDNYNTLFTTPTLTTAIKNNLIWVAVVPGVRDRARADLRRADRTRELGGRLQDGRLPPDGDLGLRHRRHLADHVRAGPEPRRDQRGRARGTRDHPPVRLARDRPAVDAQPHAARPRPAWCSRRRSSRTASRSSGSPRSRPRTCPPTRPRP